MEQMDTPLMAYESAYVIPPHKGTMTTAEDMQRHFIWVIKGFNAARGRSLCRRLSIRRAKTATTSSPTARRMPYRFRIRAPDFVNLGCCPTSRRARCSPMSSR